MTKMARRRNRKRMVPKQNKALLSGICLCQFTIILSLVSFVYLSVTIYMPAWRAFKSGYETTPVTCQTVQTVTVNNCSWASCGEWCLTKTSGFCPQIYVTVRKNGTDMILQKCSRIRKSSCPPARPETLRKFNCNNPKECSSLTGLFKCTSGLCSNMSEIYQCDYKTESSVIDIDKDTAKLNGYFECNKAKCSKVKKILTCDRFCQKITTSGMNVYVAYDNDLYSADCQKMVSATDTNVEIWSKAKLNKVLLVSCTNVEKIDNSTLRGTDCINGTTVADGIIPTPYINHTIFWSIYQSSTQPYDPEEKFLPNQNSLTIYNLTKLYINLDGCVNTLKEECKNFLITHGKDGRRRTARSRFPCFYNKANSNKAVARYDLDQTWKEFVIALVAPFIFFALSLLSLTIITRSVRVGDDAVLRCEMFDSGRGRNKNKITIVKEGQDVIIEFEEDETNDEGSENGRAENRYRRAFVL